MADQGEAYAAFIEGELKGEYERKTALEARGFAVTTQSSAFLALVLVIAALVTGEKYSWSEGGARGLLVSSIPLSIALLLGFIANATRSYDVSNLATLQAMITTRWTDNPIDARNSVASANVQSINSLRRGNNRKAGLLVIAFWMQLSAFAGLLITIGYEFRERFG